MTKKESTRPALREIVATRPLFHANEDGTSGQKDVAVYLNKETMAFEIDAPSYMVVGGTTGRVIEEPLAHEGFSNVLSIYEDLADRYSKWRLAQNRTPMLWIGMFTAPGDFAAEQFGVDAMVGLGIREVISVKDGGNSFMVDPKTFKVMNLVGGATKPLILPDTPEVRMKAAHLIASIKTAGAVLEGLCNAEDPEAYLAAINTDWREPTKVETVAETPQPPAADSGADPTFEQAMSSAGSSTKPTDDDEL